MILRSIERAFRHAKEKGWDKTYWAIDVHGTMVVPNYTGKGIAKEFYPYALETLQLLSSRKDVVMILYSCSYPHEIEEYFTFFKSLNVNFQYAGVNPEVENGEYGYFNHKPYFNVLLEDKAGFDPVLHWKPILEYLREMDSDNRNR